jgi:hypothetical protein
MSEDHIAKLQALFAIGVENPITLRAIAANRRGVVNRTFHAGQHPDLADRWGAFLTEAHRLNADGFNIYTCLNPIVPTFSGEAVCDEDIQCRRLLLIDLDRAQTAKVPATDDEIKRADEVADAIASWFSERTGEQAVRVMSGNGVHLYLRLDDLPNDEATDLACKAMLAQLASEFDTSHVKVDKAVFNASRITKVPGTIAYRGLATQDRPFRTAAFL